MSTVSPVFSNFDPASGETLEPHVDLSLATGEYIQPSEEQFEQHDVQLATTALVPTYPNLKLLILRNPDGTLRSKAEQKLAAEQISKYKRYPSEKVDSYLNQEITVVGVFEYLLNPFEKEDPKTHEKYIESNARSQKLHVIDKKGKHLMLRFGSDAIAEWAAIWAIVNGNFDWAPEDYKKIIITSRMEGGKKTYFVEEVE